MTQVALARWVEQVTGVRNSWRKLLSKDVAVAGVLVSVQLIMLAVVAHMGLLDPTKVIRPAQDNLKYQAMASAPFSSLPLAHNAPFDTRVLTPYIVFLLGKLGVSMNAGFLLITIVSLCVMAIGLYALLRHFGANSEVALVICLLAQTVYAIGLFFLWDYALVDQLSLCLLVLACLLYLKDRTRLLTILMVVAAFQRETVIAAVVAFAGEQLIRRDWIRFRRYLPAYVLPLLVLAALHVAIHSVNDYNIFLQPAQVWTYRSTLTGLSDTYAAGAANSPWLFNPYVLNLYHIFINSFAFLLPLALLQFVHPPYFARRPLFWLFMLVTFGQLVVGGDTERLLVIGLPVIVVAAWYELCWIGNLVRSACMPGGAVASYLKRFAGNRALATVFDGRFGAALSSYMERDSGAEVAIGMALVVFQVVLLASQYYKQAETAARIGVVMPIEPYWLKLLWIAMLVVIGALTMAAMLGVVWWSRRTVLLALRSRLRRLHSARRTSAA